MFIRMERCLNCTKRVLLLFKCKCDGHYCIKCKDALKHSCKFDYKKEQQEKIEKLNPIVINPKVKII